MPSETDFYLKFLMHFVNIRNNATNNGRNTHPPIIEGTQQYALYPNPNDGNFTIMQKMPDNMPVQAAIWNATGQRIYNTTLQFANATGKLVLNNTAPGLYLLQLTDEKGRNFIFKFVIQ